VSFDTPFVAKRMEEALRYLEQDVFKCVPDWDFFLEFARLTMNFQVFGRGGA
jgi:hypothetical protein